MLRAATTEARAVGGARGRDARRGAARSGLLAAFSRTASSAFSPRSPPSSFRSRSINPAMLSPANLTALAMDAALLAIVALGQLLVLITRNIDLSVASVIGLVRLWRGADHDP